jgi:hypothetical protein
MKKIVVICFLLSLPALLLAQFALTTGQKSIQFSGNITSFYNHRFYDEGENNFDKNRFNLDFAMLRVQGLTSKQIRYELQMNFPSLYSDDVNEEFLMQATAEWRNRSNNFFIQAGYDKIPFTRASLVPQSESVFLQRGEASRGRTFLRRDMGITIQKGFFNRRLALMAGVYSGQGPGTITGDNDPSGNLLYVARLEAGYPVRDEHDETDRAHSPIPRFSAGAGVTYSEKDVTTGAEYPILTVNGKKLGYSADVNMAWKGFAFHAEWIGFKVTPIDTTVLFGKPTNYFLAQGVITQLNYYFKKLKSTLAVRYDEFNPNDLIKGDTRQTVSFGYNYHIDGFDNVVKIHYFHRMKAENALEPWNENQLRIGWQILF